jgi:predicted amidophosphoribosyltransferase
MVIGAKGPFRTVELAKMFAKGYGPDATVVPAIRWVKQRDKSHKKKEFRSPDQFQPLMRVVETPANPVVVFDDVLTSGSQMIAATRVLQKAGCTVARGVVVARAGKEQVEKPIEWRNDTLVITEGFFDLDF